MELKYVYHRKPEQKYFRSNRTFMELKLMTLAPRFLLFYRSNRTFMELKYIKEIQTKTTISVLIAPLWN